MTKLSFGKNNQLSFENEEQFFETLGAFTNSKAFSISLEDNAKRGSYSDAYRIRKLSSVSKLIAPIANATRSAGRINCNEYVSYLIQHHNFVESGSVISGIFDNVIRTVPTQFANAFVKGYKECLETDNQTKEVVYKTDAIETQNITLNIVEMPNRIITSSKKNIKKRGKRDYIKEAIRNIEVGEAGEKLVYNQELSVLLQALNDGIIDCIENKIEWTSRYDDEVGYDIKSYDIKNHCTKYIEVKTSTGSSTTPFYMSENELDFSKKHSDNYYLYRLFGLTKSNNVSCFIIHGDISQHVNLEITSNGYEITIKGLVE